MMTSALPVLKAFMANSRSSCDLPPCELTAFTPLSSRYSSTTSGTDVSEHTLTSGPGCSTSGHLGEEGGWRAPRGRGRGTGEGELTDIIDIGLVLAKNDGRWCRLLEALEEIDYPCLLLDIFHFLDHVEIGSAVKIILQRQHPGVFTR